VLGGWVRVGWFASTEIQTIKILHRPCKLVVSTLYQCLIPVW